tara:strand:+ start:7841 stop:8185 length:345 start_codon:yes stop_codon:yes gene_type:complete
MREYGLSDDELLQIGRLPKWAQKLFMRLDREVGDLHSEIEGTHREANQLVEFAHDDCVGALGGKFAATHVQAAGIKLSVVDGKVQLMGVGGVGGSLVVIPVCSNVISVGVGGDR